MNSSPMNDDPSHARHPVDTLAEEYAHRLRQGEHPSIEEYAVQYPEHADLIRTIFPSLALVERVAVLQTDASISMPVMQADPMPSSLGDFEMVRRIGGGGMGVVYEAIQCSLQRHVALKVMNQASTEDASHRLRFRREAEAAAGLHHTNIVPIYGIGEDRGLQYYAMQLIDGVTLHDVLQSLKSRRLDNPSVAPRSDTRALDSKTDFSASSSVLNAASRSKPRFQSQEAARWLLQRDLGPENPSASAVESVQDNATVPLPLASSADAGETQREAEVPATESSFEIPFRPSKQYFRNVARIMANAANALEYAHHCGVLHRDIKPANLLLDREGTLWIADFGLARRIDTDGVSQAGEVVGTLRYMAPEQIRGQGDHRMDIFSLGLTLFELLTLRVGLESPKARLMDPMGHSTVRFTNEEQAIVPRDLQTIVLKACALEPEHRYRRAGELEEDMRRFLEDRPILARRAGAGEQLLRWSRRNPAIASLAAITFALLLSIAGMLGVWNRQQQVALLRIQSEFHRAEANLLEKSVALQRAEQEQSRAERNMEMALEAFDRITDNIASRGGMFSSSLELTDQDLPEFEDAWLTQADVALLQSLQEFFQRFAQENATDLRVEATVALRRVGEIQSRIGRLEEAESTLQKVVADFAAIRETGRSDTKTVLEEAAARRELIVLFLKRGQASKAMSIYQETRALLESLPSVKDSFEGRFELARILSSMVANGARFANDRRRRPPQAWWYRIGGPPPLPPLPPPMQQMRLKRESEFNRESLAILNDLVSQQPNHSAFQIALARAHKEQVRIDRALGDPRQADQSLTLAAAIMQRLLDENPTSTPFKYELAEILGAQVGFRPIDEERCQRALGLCNEILKDHPYTPEYQALKAAILTRLAILGNPGANRGEMAIGRMSEAIAIQSSLAERFPEVPIYSIALVQYHFQLSELYMALKRPEKARASLVDATTVAEGMQANGMAQPFVRTMLERIRERRANSENKNDG